MSIIKLLRYIFKTDKKTRSTKQLAIFSQFLVYNFVENIVIDQSQRTIVSQFLVYNSVENIVIDQSQWTIVSQFLVYNSVENIVLPSSSVKTGDSEPEASMLSLLSLTT